MPLIIKAPTIIEEYFGRVNSKTETLSIAKMTSPHGWVEPGQRPGFDEYTLVLKGTLQVKTEKENYDVKAGSAILTPKGEWIQYSTPYDETVEYIAVCLPAFSPETVNRDS
jgi:mannose-6-phosphate isomerase-like protein (cupin superfamily)